MNVIFHDLIRHFMEVYIDDALVKSNDKQSHITDLGKAIERMKQLKLRMNPQKCTFGVSAGNFLGFLVHE